jgi:N-acetyl-anhydromuramyl-L-alanine amidase AmpD
MNRIKAQFGLSQYFPTAHKKTRVCLHHTMGRSAESSIDYWKTQVEKVGTAYIIDRDGTVYTVFNDSFWAYQFGLRGVSARLDYEQSTIGIELANLGPLIRRNNDAFFDAYGKPYHGTVHIAPKPWREFGYTDPITKKTCYSKDSQYFEPYTEAQYQSLNVLLGEIAIKHDIKLKPSNTLDFNLKLLDTHTLITHANVRTDKTDLSPAFDWKRVANELSF